MPCPCGPTWCRLLAPRLHSLQVVGRAAAPLTTVSCSAVLYRVTVSPLSPWSHCPRSPPSCDPLLKARVGLSHPDSYPRPCMEDRLGSYEAVQRALSFCTDRILDFIWPCSKSDAEHVLHAVFGSKRCPTPHGALQSLLLEQGLLEKCITPSRRSKLCNLSIPSRYGLDTSVC